MLTMSFFLYVTLLFFFISTSIQGHDIFDMNTTDNILLSSSELKTSLNQHDNPISIGKLYL